MKADDIAAATRDYIVREVLQGDETAALDATPLVSGGILDSIATVKLVGFLEERYGVEFDAHELSEDNLDSVARIAALVQAKLSAR